jgi:hypothetical protein
LISLAADPDRLMTAECPVVLVSRLAKRKQKPQNRSFGRDPEAQASEQTAAQIGG